MFDNNYSLGVTKQVAPNPFSSQISSPISMMHTQNLKLSTPNLAEMGSNSMSTLAPGNQQIGIKTSESGFQIPDLDKANLQQMSNYIKSNSFGNQLVTNVKGAVASQAINKALGSVGVNSTIDGLTSGLTNSDGVGTKMIGGAANQALKSVASGAIAGAVSSMGKSVTTAALGQGLKQGASGALSSLGSAGGITGLANAGIQVAFGNQRKAGWENAVNTVGGIASVIPGVGWGLGAGLAAFNLVGGLTGRHSLTANNKDWQSRQAQNDVAGAYEGAMSDIADAESREGSYSGWNASGRRKANRAIQKTNNWKNTMNEWATRNDLNDIRSNQMDSINSMNYTSQLSGGYDLKNSGRMLSAKHGTKLQDTITEAKEYTKRIKSIKHKIQTDEATIDKELERYYDDPLFSTKSKYNDDFHQGGLWSEDNKTFTPSQFSLLNHKLEDIEQALHDEFPDATINITEEVEAFKKGGKISSKDPNVIPDGALHARLNHMDNKELTSKGIPVVAKDGDKLQQTAEIERNEIIFNLSVTNKLEELMKDGSAKAALEAGKLLTEEILHNTVDNTGLLKEVE